MNINIPPKEIPRRTARRSFVPALATALAVAAPASAADWYLNKNQAQYTHWATTADWKPNANGTGTSPSSLSSADTYHVNGFTVRPPEVGGTSTFAGGHLSLTHPSDKFLIKTLSSGTAVIPSLITSDGLFEYSTSGTPTLQIGHYDNRSGSTEFKVADTRALNLSIGTLVGSGQFKFYNGGTFYFSATHAAAFDGEIYVQSGRIDFNNNVNMAGRLTLHANARINLDQAITVTSLVVNGEEYPVDTYSYSELAAAHPTIFVAGTGSGSINVRAPRNWYLSTSQPIGASWNTTTHWRENPNGTGATADSINSHDNYFNQVSGRVLRTPEANDTFGGGSLVLGSGASLTLKAPNGKSSSIPALATSGTATITNGFNGITQPLHIDDWQAGSGTTTLNMSNGTILSLNVRRLAGPGNITLGTGQTRVTIDHANEFTGTFTVNSGATLNVQQTLGLNGPLVIKSGATVVLNKWIYARSLNVGGVNKTLPSYSASDLGSGFSGSGRIIIYQPTSNPPQMFGVNLAGAEFGGNHAFWQTNPAVWDYYKNKGLTLIRLPVKWHRIQSSLGGTVDFSNMNTCLNLASARGMKVIIDLHNYGAYGTTDSSPKIGSSGLPISSFVNVWTQIATQYKDHPALYGYDLMNEPRGINITTWSNAVQQAVDAVRQIDTKNYILVEGLEWSKATTWAPTSSIGNHTLDIRDPIGRLMYSAHSYWDYKEIPADNNWGSDGIYHSTDVPHSTIGKDHVRPFIEFLKTRPYAFGNVGEYAVPNNHHSSDWNQAMGVFLQYLRDNNVGATYWAGGNNWEPSVTVVNPQPTITSGDKPQMAVLQLFNNNP